MVNENIKQIIFKEELYSSIFDLKNIKEGLDFFILMMHLYKLGLGIIVKEKCLMRIITIPLRENHT